MARSTAVVTGGSGFVGSHLVRHLVAEGVTVHVVGRGDTWPWRLRGLDGAVSFHRADLRDPVSLGDLVVKLQPDVVYHLAAYGVTACELDATSMFRVNVEGTHNLVEAVSRAASGRLVHVGTGLEYGSADLVTEQSPLRPVSLYGVTKAAASLVVERAARAGLDAVIVRPFASFGPAEAVSKFVPHVIVDALAGRPVEISHGMQEREYLYVEDLVRAIAATGTAALAPGAVLNVSSSEPLRLLDLARLVVEVVGTDVPVLAGARSVVRPEPDTVRTDTALARSLLAWRPTTALRDGLKRTVAWYRDHAHEPGLVAGASR